LRIFKLKISLEKTKIYREVLIEANSTYEDLHMVIQKVFGWQNTHLFEFNVGEYKIGDMHNDAIGDVTVEAALAAISPDFKDFQYVYDFGDNWEHKIKIVDDLEVDSIMAYPVCIGGKRACPPEDCGGVDGYRKLLRNPKAYEEWLGYLYDPNDFSIDWANKRLKDRDCCRKGYSIKDLAEIFGQPMSTIEKWIEDSKAMIEEYLWEYEGMTMLDRPGAGILYLFKN